VLVAVIGTFVFSLGTEVNSAPKAQFILKDAKDKINNVACYQNVYDETHGKGLDAPCSDYTRCWRSNKM
jgi:hypothetical protein